MPIVRLPIVRPPKMMCCGLFECFRVVVFVAVIFSINSCDNLCIYYFESVSCIQCIVIKPPSKLINFPLKKIIIRVIESLGHFKLFLDDLFTFLKRYICCTSSAQMTNRHISNSILLIHSLNFNYMYLYMNTQYMCIYTCKYLLLAIIYIYNIIYIAT